MQKLFILISIVIASVWAYSSDFDSRWNTFELNTAVNIHYLTQLEKDVILEVNKLRSDPARYAQLYIEPLKQHYNGRRFNYPGDKPLMTREGVKALHECVRSLKAAQPVKILYPAVGLSKAAYDHVRDQSKNGRTGHHGSDRSGFRDRIERYGKWKTRIAENIAYGEITARQIVIYLLIDDGIYTRGHRKNFLNKDFQWIGICSGKHPSYGQMCVMEFAGEFQNFTNK